MKTKEKRILAICIDGAEITLINKWMQDGSLPTFNKLIQQGGYSSIDSFAKHLPGSNLFSFYSGQQPGNHGLYSYLIWRPETMAAQIPSSDWVNINSFWHFIKENPARGIVMNIPDAFMIRKFNGIEVLAISNDHALTPMISHPHDVAHDIYKKFGDLSFPEENYDLMSFNEFLQIRDELIILMYKMRDLYIKMMQEEQWNLFLLTLPMLHRAGHRLWSTTNIYDLHLKTRQEQEQAQDALRQVYIACDHVLNELMQASKQPDLTLVFSFYGMHANRSREVILPEMLNRVLQDKTATSHISESGMKRFLILLRNLIPKSWRHQVKRKLSYVWRYRLTSFWRMGQLNWSTVKAFVIPLEISIGIRINLKGREKEGIVQAGAEYENVCKQIMEGLMTFVDADTKNPLVKEIRFTKDVFEGEKVSWLPDLIGIWNDDPSAQHRMVSSPIYGDIAWPTPGKNPEGRSGNHNTSGFLITYGEKARKRKLENINILDFAPTILNLLRVPIPPEFEGKIFPLMHD